MRLFVEPGCVATNRRSLAPVFIVSHDVGVDRQIGQEERAAGQDLSEPAGKRGRLLATESRMQQSRVTHGVSYLPCCVLRSTLQHHSGGACCFRAGEEKLYNPRPAGESSLRMQACSSNLSSQFAYWHDGSSQARKFAVIRFHSTEKAYNP